MDGKKTRLEEVLLALSEKPARQNESLVGFLDNLHPLIKLIAPVIGVLLWLQSNFATIQMYHEQEKKIIETNQRLDGQYKELKQIVEQRHMESLSHSNDNRDRMMSVMAEIKDSLKTLFFDRQTKR